MPKPNSAFKSHNLNIHEQNQELRSFEANNGNEKVLDPMFFQPFRQAQCSSLNESHGEKTLQNYIKSLPPTNYNLNAQAGFNGTNDSLANKL